MKGEKKGEKSRKKQIEKRACEAVRAYQQAGRKTDPEGSYTGRPDPVFGEVPVQDADDL